jgi:glycine cleavage system H protein
MSSIPADLRYTKEHEYVKKTSDASVVVVGITDYAQGELGDVVFVELPKPGATFKRMQPFGTIEAVKAVSELFCPLEGSVSEVNAQVTKDPSVVNRDPYGDGWMIKLKVANPAQLADLIDAAGYKKHVGE